MNKSRISKSSCFEGFCYYSSHFLFTAFSFTSVAETFHFIVVLLQALFLQPEIHQHAISLWAPAHALWEPLEESSKHKLPSEPLTLRRVSPFCFAWLGSKAVGLFFPCWTFRGLRGGDRGPWNHGLEVCHGATLGLNRCRDSVGKTWVWSFAHVCFFLLVCLSSFASSHRNNPRSQACASSAMARKDGSQFTAGKVVVT